MKIAPLLLLALAATFHPKLSNAQKLSIWAQPDRARASEIYYGAGSEASAPNAADSFTRVKSTKNELLVQDNRGRTWFVVVGPQARSIVAASRILHILGFFVSENYFLHELNTAQSRKPLRDICLVRRPDSTNNLGTWSWNSNPFVGKQEFEGLKVAMILLANWRLVQGDNAMLLDTASQERRYVIMRAGNSLGRSDSSFGRSIGSSGDYDKAKFILNANADSVTFAYSSQSNTIPRTIPLPAAVWLGSLFRNSKGTHLADAFLAAGYSGQEAAIYEAAIQRRINALNALATTAP